MSGDVWLIANPSAGGGRAPRYASVASRALGASGFTVRLLLPSSPADTTATAAEAIAAHARVVIACGGDGTVHDVVQAVVGSDIPLGIIAAGSGDDIATSLGFPDLDPAVQATRLVDALVSGATRHVDTGHAQTSDGGQRCFVGVLSTGFDSSVNERANRMGRLMGQRYNIAMLRELASFQPRPYQVVMDGELVTDSGMLVTIGNTPRFGGGMLICPDAVMDDGLLDVTWLSAITKPSFLRMFPTVYSGGHVRHPAVRTYRARRLEIDAPGQVAYADGERIGPLPVTVEVRPGSLRVLSAVEGVRT